MKSKKQLKRERIARTCTNKRAYKSSSDAKEADPRLRPYRCPICFRWHNTSAPDMDEVDEIMREYR